MKKLFLVAILSNIAFISIWSGKPPANLKKHRPTPYSDTFSSARYTQHEHDETLPLLGEKYNGPQENRDISQHFSYTKITEKSDFPSLSKTSPLSGFLYYFDTSRSCMLPSPASPAPSLVNLESPSSPTTPTILSPFGSPKKSPTRPISTPSSPHSKKQLIYSLKEQTRNKENTCAATAALSALKIHSPKKTDLNLINFQD